jgi:hypothetical protein
MKRAFLLLAMMLVAAAALAQDKVQPPTISGITVDTGKTTAAIAWTAVGDACTNATLAEYDVRYSTSAITECNFTSASSFASVSGPTFPGGTDCADVSGLSCNTLYYVAWKVKDSAGNWSDIFTTTMTTKGCNTNQEVVCS